MKIKEYNTRDMPKRRNMAARRGYEDDARRDVVHKDRKNDYHRHDKYRKNPHDWLDDLEDDEDYL